MQLRSCQVLQRPCFVFPPTRLVVFSSGNVVFPQYLVSLLNIGVNVRDVMKDTMCT